MTRWFSSSVDLKSQKFVDVGLDSIVAALKIPRDVGKPPWSRGRNRQDSNNYNSNYGNNRGKNYERRFRNYDLPRPRVKRLRDDRWHGRPRAWNDWSQTGGMYSDRRAGGRDDQYNNYYRRGPAYGRAPRYSNWYNRRNRYDNAEDSEWVDEEEVQQQRNYGGNEFYGNHWSSNSGRNNYGSNRYKDDRGNGYNGYREQNRYQRPQQQFSQPQRQPSALNGQTNEDSNIMDTNESRPKGTQSNLAKKKVLNWPTLLISNLNPSVTDLDIYDLFQEFGNLKRANVHHDKYGNSLQTADVVFFSEEDARRALKEYDNTPLDGYVMRIFLCNSFASASESVTSSKTSQVSEDRRRQRERGGGDADNDVDRNRYYNNNKRSGSKSAIPSSAFQVNDIPKVEVNKHFMSNWSEELKRQSSKPRIPIKQGKWWHQQSSNRRSDY